MGSSESAFPPQCIAVIGMSGRFPKARNVEEFWRNLRDGVECISFFSDDEMRAAGVDSSALNTPNFVKAGGVLDGVDRFDALFFGFSARDAEIMDPQQRLFLECAWEALENAAYDPETYPGLIGVFAGMSMSTYLFNLYANADRLGFVDHFQLMVGNDKDHLTTHVSYKLNLRGPSVAVQTACSTSLVSVALACQSLLNYQSDIALAGGVTVNVPQGVGYLYQLGGIASPDGHCRAFDAAAQGTVGGNGIGIVVLKRLSEALEDGDCIHAIIRGFAMNNDGSMKVGYTAPSVDGQAEVIAMAQAMAGVAPETITYIEAHGTGTPIGDPIEIAALTKAFSAGTSKKGFCSIGSVKTNVGHLDSAAGVTGLIKTVLSLKHGLIPPTLHYTRPNPAIDFANSPFRVNARLTEWKTEGQARRAGVSSFGIGGTNVHVVLEEAGKSRVPGPSRPYQMLALSARTGTALETVTGNLARHLRQSPELKLPDVAYTCHAGRKAFNHRRVLVCGNDTTEAALAMEQRDPRRVLSMAHEPKDRPIVFLFPGQGTQHVQMARELYDGEPTFHAQVDLCAEGLRPHLGFDLREVIYPPAHLREQCAQKLLQTHITQPALFTIEYALAKLWIDWGIYPRAMMGHSIGEFVAACLAGVFSLEDALMLVAERGRLMEEMPQGSMLAVLLSEVEIQPLLGRNVSLASVNGPKVCVLSGPVEDMDRLAGQLAATGVPSRRLHTSHAYHSSMMEPAIWPFINAVQTINLNAPSIPYISNVTGTWVAPETVTNPTFWGRHLRQTVRFGDGLRELLRYPDWVLLEVGPGQTLSTLARQQGRNSEQLVFSSLPAVMDQASELASVLTTLGHLWLNGIPVSWPGFYRHERRQRVVLPAYPFESQRYWIGSPDRPVPAAEPVAPSREGVSGWFYAASWRPAPSVESSAAEPSRPTSRWMIVQSDSEFEKAVAQSMRQSAPETILLFAAGAFVRVDARTYGIRLDERGDYETVLGNLRAEGRLPGRILHLCDISSTTDSTDNFYRLLALSQALGKESAGGPVDVNVVTHGVHAVTGDEPLGPASAAVLGICKVIPQEHPNIRCRNIDLLMGGNRDEQAALVNALLAELEREPFEPTVAYRKGRRWLQTFDCVGLGKSASPAPRLRKGGFYVITGGLGAIGLTVAEYFANAVQAKLALISHSPFPEREDWDRYLEKPADDGTAWKIRKLRDLERVGADVTVISADVADPRQMKRAFDQAIGRYGAVHGVIHGAGYTSPQGTVSISEATRELCERHFRPKLQGLRVIEEMLRGRDLDFVLLHSSLSSILGGLGFAPYAAANICLDVFAQRQSKLDSAPWISVNWDAWYFPATEELAKAAVSMGAILPELGIDALERILYRAPRQIIVSTHDLDARLAQWIHLEKARDTLPPDSREEARHSRPNLSSEFVAPQTATEQTLAKLWEPLLGVTRIGSYDNFFELGGHSLLAIQLISRIREALHVELPVQKLFETPTIAALAETLDRQMAGGGDDRRLAEVLDFVETLSEEEVKALLQQRNPAEEQVADA